MKTMREVVVDVDIAAACHIGYWRSRTRSTCLMTLRTPNTFSCFAIKRHSSGGPLLVSQICMSQFWPSILVSPRQNILLYYLVSLTARTSTSVLQRSPSQDPRTSTTWTFLDTAA
ncbi:hypothetical protein PILCRDRAFT_370271 [Piloderma croceum F 1598]|uniref:Uncharacterized protein n=1 Tax=Piloderma croceum (strain F 1598) TaxID=765440 RepID=A0A0C3G2H9_PILCF|nr:hypothetical protein PILCRDRAFT_370271 [Piloderma croceum F 1598]